MWTYVTWQVRLQIDRVWFQLNRAERELNLSGLFGTYNGLELKLKPESEAN